MAFNFGAPAVSKPSLFGGATAPTSLFGAPQQQQAAPGGLFGSPAPAAPAPSLFGAPAGGLFGGAQTTAPPSLFGAPAAAPSPGLFGAAPAVGGGGGGLFGSQPAAASAPSLFGSTPVPSLFGNPPAASTSLFGQPQGQAQPQPQVGLFGASQPTPTSIPLFGQSQSAASASLFGGGNKFGSSLSQPTLLQQQQLQQQQQQQQQQQIPPPKLGDPYPFTLDPNEPSIESKIESIKKAWDTSGTECKFQTYFYNSPVYPNTVDHYKRCENGADEVAWKKAVRENPDPERLVPALALGFPSIQKRITAQTALAQSHLSTLSEIHSHLTTLSSQHSLTTSLRTLRASNTSAALSSRLLNIVSKLNALSPNRGTGIRKEEDLLRVNLESMKNEIEGGKSRVNELWSGVGALRARREEGSGSGEVEWAVADDEGLRQILEVLAQQQAGLDHLTKTLNLATDDIEVMDEAFGLKKR